MPSLPYGISSTPDRVGVRVGVVATTSPLTVSLSGTIITGAGRLSSYSPVVGHTVAMVRQDSTWLVLGQVVA